MKNVTTLKLNTLAITLALGLTSLPTLALDAGSVQDAQTPLINEFKKLDINTNDLLTHTEARKDKLFVKKAAFAKADIDNDGTLDAEEFANYKSSKQKVAVKEAASDSLITTKAKAEILGTAGLKSLQISVETLKGEVILSGFVDTAIAKAKAEEVVSKIEGVKSVKNSLEVRA